MRTPEFEKKMKAVSLKLEKLRQEVEAFQLNHDLSEKQFERVNRLVEGLFYTDSCTNVSA